MRGHGTRDVASEARQHRRHAKLAHARHNGRLQRLLRRVPARREQPESIWKQGKKGEGREGKSRGKEVKRSLNHDRNSSKEQSYRPQRAQGPSPGLHVAHAVPWKEGRAAQEGVDLKQARCQPQPCFLPFSISSRRQGNQVSPNTSKCMQDSVHVGTTSVSFRPSER